MRISKWILILSFAATPAAFADECKDVAKSINQSSRAALQSLSEDPKSSQESSQEIFKQCRKFVDLKCTQWNWLGTERSIQSFCYEAILTDDRNKKRASEELLKYSRQISPKSSAEKTRPGTESTR